MWWQMLLPLWQMECPHVLECFSVADVVANSADGIATGSMG